MKFEDASPENRRLPILRPPRRKNAEPADAGDRAALAAGGASLPRSGSLSDATAGPANVAAASAPPVARVVDDHRASLEEAAIMERELEMRYQYGDDETRV